MKTFINFEPSESHLLINSAKKNLEQHIDLFDDALFEKMMGFLNAWWDWAPGNGYHTIDAGAKLEFVATASKEKIIEMIEQLKAV